MYNDISDQIGKVAKYLHLQEVCIDSFIFKLHYVATVVIFVVYSLLVTISTYELHYEASPSATSTR